MGGFRGLFRDPVVERAVLTLGTDLHAGGQVPAFDARRGDDGGKVERGSGSPVGGGGGEVDVASHHGEWWRGVWHRGGNGDEREEHIWVHDG